MKFDHVANSLPDALGMDNTMLEYVHNMISIYAAAPGESRVSKMIQRIIVDETLDDKSKFYGMFLLGRTYEKRLPRHYK